MLSTLWKSSALRKVVFLAIAVILGYQSMLYVYGIGHFESNTPQYTGHVDDSTVKPEPAGLAGSGHPHNTPDHSTDSLKQSGDDSAVPAANEGSAKQESDQETDSSVNGGGNTGATNAQDSVESVVQQEVSQYEPFTVEEFTSKFGYFKTVILNKLAMPAINADTVCFMSSIGGAQSYGLDRSFHDYFATLMKLNHPKNSISLGLLVGEEEEFYKIKLYLVNYFEQLTSLKKGDSGVSKFISKVTLLHAPFISSKFELLDREDRHKDSVQRMRRRLIATSRNFVLYHALDKEDYTFFMDADIIGIDNSDMIKYFIDSQKDVLVPRIQRRGNPDYDKNSWRGKRTVPNQEQLEKIDRNDWENFDYVPNPVHGQTYFFSDFFAETRDLPADDSRKKLDHLIELDSVGGCILFAKSIIYKQGVNFPPNYIIGTTWERLEGYDGIETEGICYIAKTLGYSCWGMPNLLAHHSPD